MIPKREQLEHLLINSNTDFMGFSETWLCSSSPDAAISLPGYNIFRKDRLSGKGGGVLLYVKNSINCKQISLPCETAIECVGVNITLPVEIRNPESFIVICLYRQPSAKVYFYDQFKDCNFNKDVLILGDFNVNWDNKRDRKNLKLITNYYNLTQLINDPTRITQRSKTKIDLVFSTRKNIKNP